MEFSDAGKWGFVANGTPTNSFQVLAKRTNGSSSGPVNLFFGGTSGQRIFEPQATSTAASLDRDVALVVDHSGSMRRTNRWKGLKNAVDIFLQELDKSDATEHVSLTGYSSRARNRRKLLPRSEQPGTRKSVSRDRTDTSGASCGLKTERQKNPALDIHKMNNRHSVIRMRRSAERTGAITVEMALTVPLRFLLLFGLMQFADINLLRNSMTNACFVAARKAVAPGSTALDAEKEARRLMVPLGVKNMTVEITPEDIKNATPEITVSIQLDMSHMPFASGKWFKTSFLHRSCTLRREAVAG